MPKPPLIFTYYIAAPAEKVWDGFVSKEANPGSNQVWSQMFASWNQIAGWLRRLEALERAA